MKYLAHKKDEIFETVLAKWNTINEIIDILAIPLSSTLSVQNLNFTLSDFYGCWLKMEIELTQRKRKPNQLTQLADILQQKLIQRKKQLVLHPWMLCAIFLDPRFYYDLNVNELVLARKLLIEVWQKIKCIKHIEVDNQDDNREVNEVDDIENYFLSKGQPRISNNPSNVQSVSPNYDLSESDFTRILEEYERDLTRLHHKHSILAYWSGKLEQSKRIEQMLELREVAFTMMAIPPSQAACERNFSHMGFVFNKTRSKLAPEMLEDLLLIRTNRKLFSQIKADEQTKAAPTKN